MHHDWDGDWPYWLDLYKAQAFFIKLYEKATGNHPHTKEKYGTIRYESTYLWITSEKEVFTFRECIRRTVKKFPNAAGEVCCHAGFVLEDEFFEGWCQGVAYTRSGSAWCSDKRPKGV
jgi:hypothetical protein